MWGDKHLQSAHDPLLLHEEDVVWFGAGVANGTQRICYSECVRREQVLQQTLEAPCGFQLRPGFVCTWINCICSQIAKDKQCSLMEPFV